MKRPNGATRAAILASLVGGPLTLRDIMLRLGLSKSAVTIPLTALRGAGAVANIAHGVWALPSDAAARGVKQHIDKTHEELFWEKVSPEPNTGCWLWAAGFDRKGYGRMGLDGRRIGAHRLAWTLARGPIPCGLHVCHRCDNPPCVNPEHLFLGTHADNMRDRERKGRDAKLRGASNGWAKLTADAVREIRARFAAGESKKSLAQRFGVSKGNVFLIVKRLSWAHLADGFEAEVPTTNAGDQT